MKSWKVIIEQDGKTMTVIMEAGSYADAYIQTEIKYPGCTIKSITSVK